MNQRDFLHSNSSAQWAELCVALYERELLQLSREATPASTLQRRLSSLSHYVRQAAFALLDATTQAGSSLVLDIQNASWQGKQASSPPSVKQNSAILTQWLEKHARLGLVVPVEIQVHKQTRIELDSVDRVDVTGKRVHFNRAGWFSFAGQSLENEADTEYQLLKPDKAAVTAACCGFQWGVTGRIAPRTLSLREVLLSASLVWPRFTQVRRLPG